MNTMNSIDLSPGLPPSPTTTIRVAIVGAGYIADLHARAIETLDGVNLVGICDTNPRSAQAFAARWNVPAIFNSLEFDACERNA